MKKSDLLGLFVVFVLVAGLVFTSTEAHVEDGVEKTESVQTKATCQQGCDSGNCPAKCGGNCGVKSCGCGR